MQEIIEQSQVAPQDIEVLNYYLTFLSVDQTAKELGIPREQVAQIISKKEVKKVIDTVFLEQGYLNRFRMREILDTIVDQKLEEAQETGIYTNKDLVDILTFMHKISVDERKLENDREKITKPTTQTNIQVNDYGSNYGQLMERILNGNK